MSNKPILAAGPPLAHRVSLAAGAPSADQRAGKAELCESSGAGGSQEINRSRCAEEVASGHDPSVSSEERQPLERVLAGFGLHPLDEGWTPLQAFVLIKCLNEDGEAVWSFRTSEQMNLEELLGALMVQTDTLKRKLVRVWEDEDPDYE